LAPFIPPEHKQGFVTDIGSTALDLEAGERYTVCVQAFTARYDRVPGGRMRAGFRLIETALVSLLFVTVAGVPTVGAGVPKVVLGEDFGHEL
jgi:hypothetical protein